MAPDGIWSRSSPAIAAAVQRLLRAQAVSPIAVAEARAVLAELIAQTRALAMLLGREWLVRSARSRVSMSVAGMLVPTQPSYREAVAAILRRTPQLARSAAAVAQVASRGGIAFAQAADIATARRVHELLASSIAAGEDRRDVVAQLEADPGWSHAYASTVYRTNAMSAYADGVFDQARESDGLVEGFEFSATNDADTRPNHRAAHGFVARIESPVWQLLRPPLGYNCRCSLIPVTRPEARRLFGRDGIPLFPLVPAGAGPDHGFKR